MSNIVESPFRILLDQAATAASSLGGSSTRIPSSNLAPTISRLNRFLPPYDGRQRSESLRTTL